MNTILVSFMMSTVQLHKCIQYAFFTNLLNMRLGWSNLPLCKHNRYCGAKHKDKHTLVGL